jgi:hypothetical protein
MNQNTIGNYGLFPESGEEQKNSHMRNAITVTFKLFLMNLGLFWREQQALEILVEK